MFSKMFSRNGRGRVVGAAGVTSSLWVCAGFQEVIESPAGETRGVWTWADAGRLLSRWAREGAGR
jgi:hypothetical protein